MTELTDRDPAEMDHRELRAEWERTWELETATPAFDGVDRDRVWERRQELWQEMRDRVDVEMPRCPECGQGRWSQGIGDPKRCTGCGYELGTGRQDLIEQIDDAWNRVIAGDPA